MKNHQEQEDLLMFCSLLGVVTAAAILLSVGQLQLVEPVPILFGQFVVRVSRIMKPTYWMLFPTVSLPLFSIYNVLKSKGQKCVFTYCMNILFKMFTPWRQRIEFPHFYFCSLLGSAAGSFKDIIQIICVNRLPDCIGILFQNIFSANRLVRSYIKYRESKRFYNQGLGIINNSIGIISTISVQQYQQDTVEVESCLIAFRFGFIEIGYPFNRYTLLCLQIFTRIQSVKIRTQYTTLPRMQTTTPVHLQTTKVLSYRPF
ncbi:EXS_family protein [Hexamita inflata]|uniref:EXS family protein n=1 Tax=Hexamita inflata TaxID=28002 RepID=A0AA86TCP8_9EUKA|nr:EXS family protein [Hexamita inflata]